MSLTRVNVLVLKLNISVVFPLLAGDGSQASSNYWRTKHRRQECQQGCKGSEASNIQLSGFMEFFHEEVPFVTQKTFTRPPHIAPVAIRGWGVTAEPSTSNRPPQGLNLTRSQCLTHTHTHLWPCDFLRGHTVSMFYTVCGVHPIRCWGTSVWTKVVNRPTDTNVASTQPVSCNYKNKKNNVMWLKNTTGAETRAQDCYNRTHNRISSMFIPLFTCQVVQTCKLTDPYINEIKMHRLNAPVHLGS